MNVRKSIKYFIAVGVKGYMSSKNSIMLLDNAMFSSRNDWGNFRVLQLVLSLSEC